MDLFSGANNARVGGKAYAWVFRQPALLYLRLKRGWESAIPDFSPGHSVLNPLDGSLIFSRLCACGACF
ncbi:hypothetical protein MKMG_01072 [Methanogenium sp. MK-MG]|nr:hypothetical protein MKMG_01072 [Methanogenium sp. MK-MG]